MYRIPMAFVLLAISFLPSVAEAQDECGSVSIQHAGGNLHTSCDGGLPTTHPVSGSVSWNVSGSTQCKGASFGSNWAPATKNGPAAGINVNLSGQCGCPPSYVGASTPLDGEHYDARVDYRTSCAIVAGTCQCVNQAAWSHVYTAATCTSSFCCSTEGACTSGGDRWDSTGCTCLMSPLLLNLEGRGVALSTVAEGVLFDLAPGSTLERVAWPLDTARVAFVVDDIDGNGRIDGGQELLGSASPQAYAGERNGFNALALYDSNGDGIIDGRDPAFDRLMLWFDVNRDGRTQVGELVRLSEKGVLSLSLRYRAVERVDDAGSILAYQARAFATRSGGPGVRPLWLYDVFLAYERTDETAP
jgi:hypothetical protein